MGSYDRHHNNSGAEPVILASCKVAPDRRAWPLLITVQTFCRTHVLRERFSPTGWMPFLWDYAERHAETEPGNCLESEEIVLQYCKHLLYLLQQEQAMKSLE